LDTPGSGFAASTDPGGEGDSAEIVGYKRQLQQCLHQVRIEESFIIFFS